MERDVRYCTAEDGVRIAYCVTGEGPPLLACPNFIESFALDDMVAGYEQFIQMLGQNKRLIRFDMRGTGLSDRGVADFSLEALVRDVDAVVTATGIDALDVWAPMWSGMRAVAYAVQQPQRVRHLILYEAHASGTDILSRDAIAGFAALARTDWYAMAHAAAGSPHWGAEAARGVHMVGEWNRKSTSGDMFANFIEAMIGSSVVELLRLVAVPTLVLHHVRSRLVRADVVQRVAAHIAGSRMRVLDGEGPFFDGGDAARDTAEAVERFLYADEPPTPVLPSGMTAILFTDIVASTELTERMGDARFREASRSLDIELRGVIRDAGGAAIDGKLLGDGVLATFPSAAQAIEAARRSHALSGASELALHIGVHAGDVIREDNNVYGGAVNIAARLCGLSAPGEILVSDVVRGMARSSAGVEFDDRGEQDMKGIGDPVHVYAVRHRG
jgi:class 3 adenylate cyclase